MILYTLSNLILLLLYLFKLYYLFSFYICQVCDSSVYSNFLSRVAKPVCLGVERGEGLMSILIFGFFPFFKEVIDKLNKLKFKCN